MVEPASLYPFPIYGGFSVPSFMSAANAKVVFASSLALDYGPGFVYYERFLPVGFRGTRNYKTLSLLPVVFTQLVLLLVLYSSSYLLLAKSRQKLLLNLYILAKILIFQILLLKIN